MGDNMGDKYGRQIWETMWETNVGDKYKILWRQIWETNVGDKCGRQISTINDVCVSSQTVYTYIFHDISSC